MLVARQDSIVGDVFDFTNAWIVESESRIDKACIMRPFELEFSGGGTTNKEIFTFYADVDEMAPAFYRVVEQFVETYHGTNNELIIYISDSIKQKKIIYDVCGELERVSKCHITVIENIYSDEALLLNSDYYITSRVYQNVNNCSIIENGISLGICKGIISGFTTNIFKNLTTR